MAASLRDTHTPSQARPLLYYSLRTWHTPFSPQRGIGNGLLQLGLKYNRLLIKRLQTIA